MNADDHDACESQSLEELFAEFSGTIDGKALAEIEALNRHMVPLLAETFGLSKLSETLARLTLDLRSEFDSRPFAAE